MRPVPRSALHNSKLLMRIDFSNDAMMSQDTDIDFSFIISLTLFHAVSFLALSRNSCPAHVKRMISPTIGFPPESPPTDPSIRPASIKIAMCPATCSRPYSSHSLSVSLSSSEAIRSLRTKSMSRFMSFLSVIHLQRHYANNFTHFSGTRKTFITSSPRWLMILTAMWCVAGLSKGRDSSL